MTDKKDIKQENNTDSAGTKARVKFEIYGGEMLMFFKTPGFDRSNFINLRKTLE